MQLKQTQIQHYYLALSGFVLMKLCYIKLSQSYFRLIHECKENVILDPHLTSTLPTHPLHSVATKKSCVYRETECAGWHNRVGTWSYERNEVWKKDHTWDTRSLLGKFLTSLAPAPFSHSATQGSWQTREYGSRWKWTFLLRSGDRFFV